MRDLTTTELASVSGGEILTSPGQIGIALTENTLLVVTGTTEAAALLQLTGAAATAFGAGYAIGSALVEFTDIEHTVGGWFYKLSQCFN